MAVKEDLYKGEKITVLPMGLKALLRIPCTISTKKSVKKMHI